MIKGIAKSRNIFPPPASAINGEINNVTYDVSADGIVTLSGTATATTTINVNLKNHFIVPTSSGKGGHGTVAFNNTVCIGVSVIFVGNGENIDEWSMNSANRVHTSYSIIGEKELDSYIIRISSGTNCNNFTCAIAFSNDDVPVSPYEPYGGIPKDITRITMFDNGVEHEGWEVRDQQGRIIWGADKTLTGTDSITYKGYGLDIKEYDIDGNMVQAAEKEYSITGTSPLDFQSNGSNATISISGNETQASSQAYTTSGTSPLSFNADGTNLTALSMDGNMNQASSQPYTTSGTSPISFMNNGTAIDYTVSGNMNQTGTPTPSSPITPVETGDLNENLAIINTDSYSLNNWYYEDTRLTDLLAPGTYTISFVTDSITSGATTDGSIGTGTASDYTEDVEWFTRAAVGSMTTVTVTLSESKCLWARFVRDHNIVKITCSISVSKIRVEEGSIAYGYKIPISNGSTTYNIYLSEPLRKIGDYADTVESDGTVTRKIKKIVFDGTENWQMESGNPESYNYLSIANVNGYAVQNTEICSHFQSNRILAANAEQGIGVQNKSQPSAMTAILVRYTGLTTDVATFKTYLQQQYTAGTPVTVWYVLSTAQTDTATVPTITPTSGNNTLSVDTTLAPSNITITSNSSVFPGNPITPIECGVKTENLFDKSQTTGIVTGKYINQAGGISTNQYYYMSYPIRLTIGETYTWSFGTGTLTHSAPTVGFYDSGDNLLSVATHDSSIAHFSFTIPQGCAYIRASIYKREPDYPFEPMLISGTVPQADNIPIPWYEPYGYKIPVTCGGNTYNIFTTAPLRKIGNYSDSIGSDGVVTRNIKKVVLDGTEDWNSFNSDLHRADISIETSVDTSSLISSHYEVVVQSIGTFPHCYIGGNNGHLYIFDPDISSNTDWKTYLANQYSAGTPVEVWYVLSTPDTTETTTIPTISTVNGANTLTTQTPITPSNITISTSSSVYPKNPIYPEECGDKTINLFNPTSTPYATSKYLNDSGSETSNSGYNISYYIEVEPETDYRLSGMNPTSGSNPAVCFYNSSKQYISGSKYAESNSKSFTTPENTKYIKFSYGTSATEIMLKQGSASEQYEPYGYKIPITIGNNTNYIYTKEPIRKIGDYADVVSSDGTVTRRIKKLVLDGAESWEMIGGDSKYYRLAIGELDYAIGNTGICTHYELAYVTSSTYNVGFYISNPLSISKSCLNIRPENVASTTVNSFKQFLANQYADKHPVTVWYVLANPTTEQTTFPTITPTSGSNTLSVNTTLAPSSITLTTTSGVWSKNPIEPEEFGDKTENLFDDNNAEYGKWVSSDGTIVTNATYAAGYDIKVGTTSTFTIKYYGDKPYSYSMVFYDSNGDFLSRDHKSSPSSSYDAFHVPENAVTARFQVAVNTSVVMTGEILKAMKLMLNLGSTALPYEPFGYKIPITNAGQTYNIYLSEPLRKISNYEDVVNSDGTVTRQIKKIVLTGADSEGWRLSGGNLYAGVTDNDSMTNQVVICSHFQSSAQSGMYVSVGAFRLKLFSTSFPSGVSTVAEFRVWLSDEYTAGRPVTVWYVLASPTTETITTPTIATTVGTNILTVDTTLVPSKTTITGHIKPIHFGFKIDKTNSNSDTAVTYTHDAVTMTPAAMNFTTNEFNYGSWENVWFVKDAYPVALNLDGTEAYKLNPDDYTKKDDGTDSDIQFVLLTEAPSDWSTQWKQYYTKDANDNYELNSQSSAPTFTTNTYYKLTYNSLFTGNFMMALPKVYFRRTEDATYNYVEVSDKKLGDDWYAYAHINTNGQEVDFIYLPLFKGVIVNSKLRSIPGVIPSGGTTAPDEAAAASACGSRWQMWDHSSVNLINDLMILMSKSIDGQGKFGKGRESGYNSSDTVTYGKLQTGTLVKGGKFKGFSSSYKEVKVFGIEGFWANRWERIQGMLLDYNVWKIKMTPPYNFTGTNFVTLSNASVPSGTGYLSRVQTSQYGSIPASIEGGAEDKFYRDYFFKSATKTCVAMRAGNCDGVGLDGPHFVYVEIRGDFTAWSIGASPVYK